jgi:hypothetical protein
MTQNATLAERMRSTLTPRAQLGLIALLALLALVALLELSSRNEQLRRDTLTVRTEYAGRLAALEQRDWTQVLNSAASELTMVEDRFWRAETTGLASAEILGAVEAAARRAELSAPRVSVLRSDLVGSDVILFEVEVTARSNNGRFATFLEALVESEGLLQPSELEWQGQNRPVTVRLVAPALVEGGDRS